MDRDYGKKTTETRNTIVEPVDAAHDDIYAVARLTIYEPCQS